MNPDVIQNALSGRPQLEYSEDSPAATSEEATEFQQDLAEFRHRRELGREARRRLAARLSAYEQGGAARYGINQPKSLPNSPGGQA